MRTRKFYVYLVNSFFKTVIEPIHKCVVSLMCDEQKKNMNSGNNDASLCMYNAHIHYCDCFLLLYLVHYKKKMFNTLNCQQCLSGPLIGE